MKYSLVMSIQCLSLKSNEMINISNQCTMQCLFSTMIQYNVANNSNESNYEEMII